MILLLMTMEEKIAHRTMDPYVKYSIHSQPPMEHRIQPYAILFSVHAAHARIQRIQPTHQQQSFCSCQSAKRTSL